VKRGENAELLSGTCAHFTAVYTALEDTGKVKKHQSLLSDFKKD